MTGKFAEAERHWCPSQKATLLYLLVSASRGGPFPAEADAALAARDARHLMNPEVIVHIA
jgi:hypothetical protein